MDGKTLLRLGAVIFVTSAVAATVIEFTWKDEEVADFVPAERRAGSADPLREELIRCAGLGEGALRDASCFHIWAENRRRFLTPGLRSSERSKEAAPPASTEPAPQAAPPTEAR